MTIVQAVLPPPGKVETTRSGRDDRNPNTLDRLRSQRRLYQTLPPVHVELLDPVLPLFNGSPHQLHPSLRMSEQKDPGEPRGRKYYRAGLVRTHGDFLIGNEGSPSYYCVTGVGWILTGIVNGSYGSMTPCRHWQQWGKWSLMNVCFDRKQTALVTPVALSPNTFYS